MNSLFVVCLFRGDTPRSEVHSELHVGIESSGPFKLFCLFGECLFVWGFEYTQHQGLYYCTPKSEVPSMLHAVFEPAFPMGEPLSKRVRNHRHRTGGTGGQAICKARGGEYAPEGTWARPRSVSLPQECTLYVKFRRNLYA